MAKCHRITITTLTRKHSGSDRINCRIKPAIKKQAEEAAQLLGQSITAFTEIALAEKAQSVLAEQERLALSERDFARFSAILEEAVPPTTALTEALRGYQATQAKHPDHGL